MTPCTGYRGPCPSRAPGVVTRRGRALCAACDEREQGDKRRRDKRAGKREAAHQRGELCDAGRRGKCPACATPKAHGGARPGAGRPPLAPGEESVQIGGTRITHAHYLVLRRVIAAGHATTMAEAVRWCVEQAGRSVE